jgi:hypothetical protein
MPRPLHLRALSVALALGLTVFTSACKREPIGGSCSSAMNCAAGAERCFKSAGSTEGVCSKTCTADSDCGAIAKCESMQVTHSGGVNSTPATFTEKWCMPKKK